MTNFGFVINNRTCIGCHACSTACKSENEVPLGVYRTWVKYTETGAYPDTRRNFQVTRCNHCANPPCVRICPVTAMYQRTDGIVEFDPEACIGCKACMQACPYDAIHIDPESGTAAKCHYCSHRTDLGLEPACVVVCPEHAIIAGDMDDPESEISRVLAKEQVSVRKPEQGTAPKLFYIEGNDIALTPTAAEHRPQTFMWADVLGGAPDPAAARGSGGGPRTAASGVEIRSPESQGYPSAGPIQFSPARMSEHMVQVGYNAQHALPWHWPVPAYLVTKGIGAGLFLLLALAYLFGWAEVDRASFVVGGFVSQAFIALTTALLVYDLERPERFLRVIFRPQTKSWLVRGAFLLIGFTVVGGLWWLLEAAAHFGALGGGVADAARAPLLILGVPFAIGAAVYTAFLFGQAEGRDLWQSTLLPAHLVIQAVMMGAAALLVMAAFGATTESLAGWARDVFLAAVAVDLFVTLFGELGMPHASDVAARAAHEIHAGKYKGQFWAGSVFVGHVLPFGLVLASPTPALGAFAAVACAVGLYLFEHAFVMAPQEVPNS